MYVVEYWAEDLTWHRYLNIKPNEDKKKVQTKVKRYRQIGAGTLRVRKLKPKEAA